MSLSNMEEQTSGESAPEKQQENAVVSEPQPTEEESGKESGEKVEETVSEEVKDEMDVEPSEEKAEESIAVESETREKETEGEGKEQETPKQGLLDKPLVIEGKRERHTVNRLVTAPTPAAKKSSIDASGSGTPLGEIEFVSVAIGKVYSEGLKSLHRLCYGTPGVATTRKRDLRKFNGFPFDVDSPEFEKRKATAMKLNSSEIRDIRKVLGFEAGHTKEESAVNMLKFLQKPRDLGMKVPGSKKRKSTAKSPKAVKKAKKATPKKQKKDTDTEKESEGEEQPEEDEPSEESEPEEVKPEKVAPKKAAKTAVKRSTGGIKLKKPAEKSSMASPVPVSPSKSETPNKWGASGPSDEELNAAINELLHSVDLVHCTMKQMCQRISEKFPNLDMVTYKGALKDRVKEALEQMEDA